jgi:hypothetical protein
MIVKKEEINEIKVEKDKDNFLEDYGKQPIKQYVTYECFNCDEPLDVGGYVDRDNQALTARNENAIEANYMGGIKVVFYSSIPKEDVLKALKKIENWIKNEGICKRTHFKDVYRLEDPYINTEVPF